MPLKLYGDWEVFTAFRNKNQLSNVERIEWQPPPGSSLARKFVGTSNLDVLTGKNN